jgi:hypothetical protein
MLKDAIVQRSSTAGIVAHAFNPSYSGGDQEDGG